ncbi:DUF2141 domain-containing protein [Paucibacter sp. M5-1]|uniref:DUF2141 domain-containing protein n=1 Tax=Paucibacter sp. M5-1 TaxID=3015998 RepID=UPI0022B8A4B1|nr:DUF2141 domain-containing protein [Paucibacter sp. M5-1]MCZ7884932.1 DUF2141 domain-containing protein [Paucibacter sp. M5-1]
MKNTLLIPLLALFSLFSLCSRAAELDLDVQGLSAGSGQLLVAVFGAEGWLRQPIAASRQDASAQQGGALRVLLKNVPEGLVGVSIIHDLNGNGRLDMNAMGMPQEPTAFSNNAVGQFGPPRFEQAAFELKGEGARLTIKLN